MLGAAVFLLFLFMGVALVVVALQREVETDILMSHARTRSMVEDCYTKVQDVLKVVEEIKQQQAEQDEKVGSSE